MNSARKTDFNFDEWSALAREDATAFERRRKEMIDGLLAAAPEHLQQRLRGLQFQIDMERQRAGTPLGATVRLNSMMWSRFADLRSALSNLAEGAVTSPQNPGATLIQFPKRI